MVYLPPEAKEVAGLMGDLVVRPLPIISLQRSIPITMVMGELALFRSADWTTAIQVEKLLGVTSRTARHLCQR